MPAINIYHSHRRACAKVLADFRDTEPLARNPVPASEALYTLTSPHTLPYLSNALLLNVETF
jgi:hypothetical protein